MKTTFTKNSDKFFWERQKWFIGKLHFQKRAGAAKILRLLEDKTKLILLILTFSEVDSCYFYWENEPEQQNNYAAPGEYNLTAKSVFSLNSTINKNFVITK